MNSQTVDKFEEKMPMFFHPELFRPPKSTRYSNNNSYIPRNSVPRFNQNRTLNTHPTNLPKFSYQFKMNFK